MWSLISALLLGTAASAQGTASRVGPRAATSSDVIFAESFESGNLSQWYVQGCPGGVTISTTEARVGTHSARFYVGDNDTHAHCANSPNESPRAQLTSHGLFDNGDEYYIAFSTFFPLDFPKPTAWFQFAELYGPPFNGTPTMSVNVCDGNRICFGRDASHNDDTIWKSTTTITLGKWRDTVLRVGFNTDPTKGFVEIWDNGVHQTLVGGSTRIYYQTLNPKVNWEGTKNSLMVNQYRSAGQKLGYVTLYHDAIRVGTSYGAVVPSL